MLGFRSVDDTCKTKNCANVLGLKRTEEYEKVFIDFAQGVLMVITA